MNVNDKRMARWFAWYLGELPESERAEVEAEMAAEPEEAERVRNVCLGVESWAGEAVESNPLDVEAVYAAAGRSHAVNAPSAQRGPLTKVWPWAAAAAFVIALSQISFSIQLGDSVIAWGQPGATTESLPSSELLERLAAIETATSATRDEVTEVVEQASALELELQDATAELAYNQQLESQARYRDIQRILSITGLGDYSMAAYYEP